MLLAAIAALASPTSSEPTAPQPSPARPNKAPEVSAERRPITVVFCDLSSEPTAPQPSPARPNKAPEVSAERRPITVVFCDLVGSTSLAAKLDTEDWRSLVNAYLDELRRR